MNAEQFVDVIKLVVRDSAIEDTISVLTSPPGRRPAKDLVELSNYYNSKNNEEKNLINGIIKQVADDAVFGFLCVLDGVIAIEDGTDKGTLSLIYNKGEDIILNKDEDLHDYYNAV